MPTYTVTLTDAEDLALNHVSISAQAWIENAVKERARIAMEQIVKNHVDTQLKAGKPLAGTTHEEIILNAGLETAVERNARYEAEQQAKMNTKN